MNISKLPASPPAEPVASPPSALPPPPPPPLPPHEAMSPELWLSLGMGIIVLVLFPRFGQYLMSRSHPESFTWTFASKDGLPLSYPQSAYFLPDLGMTLFGVVLILDAVALLRSRSAPLLGAAVGLTTLSVLLNLIAIALAFNEIGFQIWCAVAAAFGAYLAHQHWHELSALRRHV